jgi:hypothetical protein
MFSSHFFSLFCFHLFAFCNQMNQSNNVDGFCGTGLTQSEYHVFREELKRRCRRSRRVRYAPAERLETFAEAQIRVSQLTRPISNWSGHPVGSLEWWMYGIRSHHEYEREVTALLDIEELVAEIDAKAAK